MDYFTNLKIENAKKLIRETDKSVKELSELLSFDTPNYFGKIFKKYTSYTPMQYKKLISSTQNYN